MATNKERIAAHNALIDQAQAKVDALPEAGSGGAEPVVQPLTVTENGTYEAPDGVDGYSPVTVNVPEKEPVLEALSVTENGTYTPSGSVDGYSSVTVAVPDKGVELPELDTPGSAADLRTGKQLIGGDGKVVEGSMPDVEVPTPSVSVSSAGLVTASVNQSAGYTPGGSKSGTEQLTTQAAKTVIPSKSTQTAVAAQRYTTEDVEVAPIPDEYIVPSGTKRITENGTHDVTGYASVNVEVAGSGGGGAETCTVTIIRTGVATMKFPLVIYPVEANNCAYEDIKEVGTYTIQCKKETLIAIEDADPSKVSSTEAVLVTGSSGCVVLYIVDDCTITVKY